MQLTEPKAFIAYKEDLLERFCILVLNCLLMFFICKAVGIKTKKKRLVLYINFQK